MRFLVSSCAAVLCTISMAVGAANAAAPLTANTLRYDASAKPAGARIEIMAWFAGSWRGEGLGGLTEEIWSAPEGGRMMGMYRLLKGGKPVFYEFLVLEEDAGNLFFRLKHFHPDLKSWEAQDEREEFGFIAQKGNRYYFDGMTLEKVSNDAVTIYLAIEERGGKPREEVFHYRRQTE